MEKRGKRLESLSDGALLAIAMIWGGCFPFVKMCLNAGLTSMQMLSSKFVIAAIITLAVFFKDLRTLKKDELKKGVLAGLILFVANYASTAGLARTSSANGAIITSVYIILIPFLWCFMGKA
jgi:drug/metabolite transporter (DMT)-like permease